MLARARPRLAAIGPVRFGLPARTGTICHRIEKVAVNFL
ncbi:Uncharacterized protein APZ42_020357 [Daphnia magna]|uniref:Uncharacterized protein n=1 Tax=Daphnia magna TaxID=35525 RepID=A0A164XJY7_9CRUS|nr:Uncharacterized protein APZ42_020357 [Daphnia magna]